eukprot:6833273-Pyramimonas_sp.AAC.1
MAAVMAYALYLEFSHDDALKHKASLRSIINAYAKERPRDPSLQRILVCGELSELDDATRRFAYGDANLPPAVNVHGAGATYFPCSLRREAGVRWGVVLYIERPSQAHVALALARRANVARWHASPHYAP